MLAALHGHFCLAVQIPCFSFNVEGLTLNDESGGCNDDGTS